MTRNPPTGRPAPTNYPSGHNYPVDPMAASVGGSSAASPPVAHPTPVAQPGPRAVPVAAPIPTAPSPASPPSAPVPVRPVPPSSRMSSSVAPHARPEPRPANAPIPLSPDDPDWTGEPEDLDDAPQDAAEFALKNSPPWLISLIVHCVLMILLALWALPQLVRTPLEINAEYAESLGEQLLDDSLDFASIDDPDISDPVFSEDMLQVEDPLAAMPDIEPVDVGNIASTEISAPNIGLALTGREEGAKRALLAAYGGTALTEKAVADGLAWLARQQKPNGEWSLRGPYSRGANGENKCAATAMALLAFLGAGHTPERGKYKEAVSKGVDRLLKMQDNDGNFYNGNNYMHQLYSHAQATIAICELYGMTKDSRYQQPAQKAIDYAVAVQAPEGGWRYSPRSESDTSVTGWFAMAMQSALMADLEVPEETLNNISRYLDSVAVDYGAGYAYMPGRRRATLPMTAEGLLCRQYLGWRRNDDRLLDGAEQILGAKIGESSPNVYYWYYATQVTHHMGGEIWDEWNKAMRVRLPDMQVSRGKERGSWDPTRDAYGAQGGRLYVTCLSIYMLEVYYRHLPIYDHIQYLKGSE